MFAWLHLAGDFRKVVIARADARNPHPTRKLRGDFRKAVIAKSGTMDVDMMACDTGPNAWCDAPLPPLNSALGASLLAGSLWRFLRIDRVGRVAEKLSRVRRGGC